VCGTVVGPRIPVQFRTVSRQPARYAARSKAYVVRKNHRTEQRDDPGGVGWQIVSEKRVCPVCAERGE
jgi:hypothetical protein